MTANPRGQRKRPGSRLGLSVVIGLLAIPLAAIASVTLMGNRGELEAATTETTAKAAAPVVPPIPQYVYSDVEATSEDLAYACGVGGLNLVAGEETGTLTEIEQSALDALRGICEAQGTPLPGKPAPPPIVETRTVTVQAPPPPPPPSTATNAPTTTTIPVSTSTPGTGSATTTTVVGTSAPPTTAPMGTEERYLAVHDQAVAEIEYAVANGGKLGKIDEARKKLEEAERKAAAGSYEEATTQAYEAIGKAREALDGGGG